MQLDAVDARALLHLRNATARAVIGPHASARRLGRQSFMSLLASLSGQPVRGDVSEFGMPCWELAAAAVAGRSPGLARALAGHWLQPTVWREMWATGPLEFEGHCTDELSAGRAPNARTLTLSTPSHVPAGDADVAADICARAYRFVVDWMADAVPGEIHDEWETVDGEWRAVTLNAIRNVPAVLDRRSTDDVMPGFIGWNEYTPALCQDLREHARDLIEQLALADGFRDKDHVVTLMLCRFAGLTVTLPAPLPAHVAPFRHAAALAADRIEPGYPDESSEHAIRHIAVRLADAADAARVDLPVRLMRNLPDESYVADIPDMHVIQLTELLAGAAPWDEARAWASAEIAHRFAADALIGLGGAPHHPAPVACRYVARAATRRADICADRAHGSRRVARDAERAAAAS